MIRIWHHTKKVSAHVGRSSVKLFFPYIWHYFTDDYKLKAHHLVVDSIFSIVAMTLVLMNIGVGLGLLVFFQTPQFEASVSTESVVISGAPLSVTVQLNSVSKTVSNVDVTVLGPSGFSTDTTQFHYDVISKGDEKTISIPGYFTGNVEQGHRFLVLYRYDYYGQHYQGVTTVEFIPVSSSLELVPHLPEDILNNEEFTWTVDYTNSSDQTRADTCIQLDIPSAFTITSIDPTLNEYNQVCYESLQPRSSGTISVTGSFSNAIGEGNQIISITGIDQATNKGFVQVKQSHDIRVLTPRLSLATSGGEVINVGDVVRYTNSYTNTGDATLRDVTVTTVLNDFDGKVSAVTADQGSVNGNVITWVDPELLPGETHSKTFNVATNPNLRQQNAAMSYSTSIHAQIDDIGVTTYARSVSKGIKYNSTLFFEVVQRYTSPTGEQLGYGPYPLVADDITGLRVFWQIEDFTNDLSNVTIQTTLPSQVEWTGIASVTEGSAITYNPATRVITWHTSSVPSFSHAQGAQFEVRVRPNSAQIGQTINITNDTQFTAFDSFTGVVMKRTVSALRTPQTIQP